MSSTNIGEQQLLQPAVNRDDELMQSPPTAQFLIGGSIGAGAGGIKSGNPDEVTHPLQKLDPDSWNNIPICLVKAVKMLIESNISTDQKMRQFNNSMDTNVRKLTAAIAKNEKDLTKKEEQLKSLIERMEKHLTTNFTQKTNDLEAMCWRNRDTSNDINNKFGKELHEVGMRLDNMMTSQQIKEHVEYALDHQLAFIRQEYKTDLFRVETILNEFTNQFQIPGIVGDKNSQYGSVNEFIKDTYKENQKSFEKIQTKLYDFEHRQFKDVRTDIGKLQSNVDKFNQNFNDDFWKQQHQLADDLKNFSTSLSKQNDKMSEIETTVTGKLKSSQDMMFDMKSEMDLKQFTIDSMKKQINEIRSDIGEQANQIRILGQDLSNCQQKVTKIDRAQASQAQMSMASFHEPKSGADSRGAFGKKPTGPPSDNNAASSNNVINNAELEKLKVRMLEVERILMSQELTMKKLGDDEAEAIVHANHSSSAGTSINNKSAAKFDRDWTQKVELKISKISSTIKALTNKVTDIMHGNGGNNRDHIYVGGSNNNTIDQHRRSQSLITGSQNSLKLGGGRGDGTPGNSEYNRRGTAPAGNSNGGSRRKKQKNSSQHNSNGTLENGIFTMNMIENAKIKYQVNIDGTRSISPPSTSHNQNRRSSAGASKNIKTPAPRDNSIDEKTAKHMMRISELINQTANADLHGELSSKKKNKNHFPTVEDVFIQLASPAQNNSGSRSPKHDVLNGPLIGDKLFGLQNQQRRSETTKNGQTPSSSSQMQRQGRQFAQTPNANVPELQLATFSNQVGSQGGQGQVKPLYIINEENNIMMQRGANNGGYGQTTVLPNLDIKKATGYKKQPAAQMLNDEMQAIIRSGQMVQSGNRTSAHHHRRIPSSQLSNMQNSPHGEDHNYLQSGIYHQQPLSVKFEGMQQFSWPSTNAALPTGITTPVMRR